MCTPTNPLDNYAKYLRKILPKECQINDITQIFGPREHICNMLNERKFPEPTWSRETIINKSIYEWTNETEKNNEIEEEN